MNLRAVERTPPVALLRPLHIVGDEQIRLAVLVVIKPGGAAPHGFHHERVPCSARQIDLIDAQRAGDLRKQERGQLLRRPSRRAFAAIRGQGGGR